jgi:uncharacterized membrane protein YbhN (UPF0104 family)
MAITYAGNAVSMSIPFAGAQLAAVFSYQQFRRRGLDPALTGWALGISAIASSSALALILIAGALAGGAPIATLAGFAGAAVFALPAVTVLLALRYPRARAVANRALAHLVRLARRVFHKPGIDPAVLDEFLTRLAGIRLKWPRYAEVFGLAALNWLADCACLACAIRATGESVPWRGLILSYGAGAAAGSTGVTPGGFGLVEVTLTAALVATGMATSKALTAVFAYRLINFWLILLGGGIAMAVLARAREHRARLAARDAIYLYWQTVHSDIASSQSARAQAYASAHAARLAKDRYQAGAATQLDLLTAERDAYVADVVRIQADADLGNARTQLRLAAGIDPFAKAK